MRGYKHTKFVVGVLFFGGLVFVYFALGKSDFFSVFTVIIIFSITGFLAGQEMVYDKYDRMHYSALEDDAKKRREKDKRISDEVDGHIKQHEKENSDSV